MASYLSDLALCVGGEWRGVSGRDTRPVINPSTCRVIGQLPLATKTDIAEAIAAADAAFPAWSALGPWQRAGILQRAAALIGERRAFLAGLLTLENGKPVADSLGEIDRVIDTLVFCAEEGKRVYGRLMPPRAAGLRQMQFKRPLGPVGAFSPWNFPAVLAMRKVAAALSAGCTVVLKPAEECPAVCIELVRAMHEAGVPGAALNLLFGLPVQISEQVIDAEAIRKISFTGSVSVGRLLAARAGDRLKPMTMELGGHAPVVVFDDVDVERAVTACVAFKFRNAGQVCLAPSRFYVQERVYARFIELFVQRVKNLRMGDGFAAGTQMGPLNNERRLLAAQSLVDDACAHGARVETGGGRVGNEGFFFAPTVLTGLSDAARVLHDEPFCPVAPIVAFEMLDDVIARANNTRFGLAAYVFTSRLDRAYELSERIQAGWLGINNFTPALAEVAVGGMKDSGLGYEGGIEGLDAYLHTSFLSQAATIA